jgi:WD40-like Beta Propeller Repeat
LRPRDFIIVAAVVLIAGFAAADALRGRTGEKATSGPETTRVQTTPTRLPGPTPQPDAPEGWPVGLLDGSVVFTNAGDCRIRIIGLAGGTERPLARFLGTCDLWVPPVSDRVAYALGPPSGDGFTPFKLADLARPNADLGGFRALFGVVLWSPDGQRVAWCGRRQTGYDLEVGGPVRRLPACPVAYAPDSKIAYAVGNKLLVEDAAILQADGGITYAHFGTDGSVAIVVDGERLERYDGAGDLTAAAAIPQGRTPILSPRNCAALFKPFEGYGPIRLVELGCYHGRELRDLSGSDAAWSPDGAWVAVAEAEAITFHPVAVSGRTVTWPAGAADVAWRPR